MKTTMEMVREIKTEAEAFGAIYFKNMRRGRKLEYNEIGETILMVVCEIGSPMQKAVASVALDGDEVSERQAHAIAKEFIAYTGDISEAVKTHLHIN